MSKAKEDGLGITVQHLPAALAPLTQREREMLAVIRDEGPITRAALIQRSGLSGPAVFRVTEELAAKNYLAIGEPVACGRGQPSNLVKLNPEAMFTLGISVMNDFAEAAIIDLTGSVRAIADVSCPGMRRADVLRNTRDFLELNIAQGMSRAAFGGVGVAIAAYFVEGGRLLNPASALDDWALVDLTEEFSAYLGLPVTIDNIANAAAVGELMMGVGARFPSFAYVNFAFGFGGGLVIDGKPWRGEHGNAGEFAGMLDDLDVFIPSLESLRLRLNAQGKAIATVTELVENFDPSWPVLDGWVADAAGSLKLLAQLIGAAMDVEAMVLGGRLPQALAARLAQAAHVSQAERDAAARRGISRPVIKVVPAAISSRASVIGAAALSMPFLRASERR
jgi:predicted NBD/HSP70 family sugar kinase